VRDAGRQLSHGFHLLGLAKLLLEESSFGDVLNQTPRTPQRLVIAEGGFRAQQDPADRVIRPVNLEFAGEDCGLAQQHVGNQCATLRAILGEDQGLEVEHRGAIPIGADAKDAIELGRRAGDTALRVPRPASDPGEALRLTKLLA